jgi:hypothetical protein
MTVIGKKPGFIKSYDPDTRMCTVAIPGITDGASEFPEAEIEYPIGDKSASNASTPTEIEILAGDAVWLEFENGDERFPIITGYRNPRSGNSSTWRRYHHENFEILTDALLYLTPGTDLTIVAGQNVNVTCQNLTATVQQNAEIEVTGTTTLSGDGAVTIESSAINLNTK